MLLQFNTSAHASKLHSSPQMDISAFPLSRLSQITDLIVEKILTPIVKVLEQLLQRLKAAVVSLTPVYQQPSRSEQQNLMALSSTDIHQPPPPTGLSQSRQLTSDDRFIVAKLKRVNAQIIKHEMQHKDSLGHSANGPQYETTLGPDGNKYATKGWVVPLRAPKERAVRYCERVFKGALAPEDPSPEDLSLAENALSDMKNIKNIMLKNGNTSAAMALQNKIDLYQKQLDDKKARQATALALYLAEVAAESALEVAEEPDAEGDKYYETAVNKFREMIEIKDEISVAGRLDQAAEAQQRIDKLKEKLQRARLAV